MEVQEEALLSKSYLVRQVYDMLQDTIVGEEGEVFSEHWTIKALPLAQHFALKLLMNKVATKNNLSKTGINMICRSCIM